MTSYRNWVVELSNTVGVGAYALAGPPVGSSYFTFRARFVNGDNRLVYEVTNPTKTKWEKSRFATLTYGTPDTLTRNVVESTNGDAPVSWVAGDLPLRVYVAPDADAPEGAISGFIGLLRNPLLKFGHWFKQDDPSSGKQSLKIYDGNSDIQIGVIDSATHTFLFDPSVVGERAFSTQTFTAQAIVEFLDIPITVNNIRIEIEGITGTDNSSIHMQTAGADGAYDGGLSDYQFTILAGKSSGASGIATNATSDIFITEAIKNTGANAAQGYAASIKASNIQAATHTKFLYQSCWNEIGTDNLIIGSGVGIRREAARIRHVRLYSTLGVMTGKATLFAST